MTNSSVGAQHSIRCGPGKKNPNPNTSPVSGALWKQQSFNPLYNPSVSPVGSQLQPLQTAHWVCRG